MSELKRLVVGLTAVGILMTVLVGGCTEAQMKYKWEVHDMNRPRPEVITPGEVPSEAPSDAIVLFDGKDLSEWVSVEDGGRPKWKVTDGYMEVIKEGGDIRTKRKFGDVQLHVEWATPAEVKGKSQGRGNSGVFFMDRYEVQVLDSYENDTYPDGQAAALYGQKPPLVNACKGPGQWQVYDIVFHRPVFKGGKVDKPAAVTVFQNGVLVQDHWEIKGTTFHKTRAAYEPHEDRLPLKLQDHGNPVRYRNIWVREL